LTLFTNEKHAYFGYWVGWT